MIKSKHPPPKNLSIKSSIRYTRSHLPNSTITIRQHKYKRNISKSPNPNIPTSLKPPKLLYKYLHRKPIQNYVSNKKPYKNLNLSISNYLTSNHFASKLYIPKTLITTTKHTKIPKTHKCVFQQIRSSLYANQKSLSNIIKCVPHHIESKVTISSPHPPDPTSNLTNKDTYPATQKK